MRKAYQVLAGLIALEVVVQAAAMVYAVSGLGIWVDEGGTFDKAALESEDLSFTGIGGLILHGINGMMVIPLLGLLLLIVAFFAKVPGGVKWAAITLLLIVVQVALGLFGHSTPFSGALHGANALVLFSVAAFTAHRAGAGRSRTSDRDRDHSRVAV